MEVEDHHYSLPRFDVPETFQIPFLDNERPLNFGNAPVPRNGLRFRPHEANRFQHDAHVHELYTTPGRPYREAASKKRRCPN